MDISKIKADTVEDTIVYRNQKIAVEIAPSIYTNEDNALSVAEYCLKGLKSWDLTFDGEPLEISVESLTNVIPDGVLTLIFDKILHLKQSEVGKLKSLK